MEGKVIICAYGKNGSVEDVFLRLYATYLSNFNGRYVYFALIDLPDGISYRMAGDSLIEDEAMRLFERFNALFGGKLTCAVRQRRSKSGSFGGEYVCEGGARGALATLWRHSKGKDEGLFPIFGCDETRGADSIYFSADNGQKDSSYIDVIEPGGISRLGRSLGVFDAVFALTGAMERRFGAAFEPDDEVFEGLYGAGALDKIICADPIGVYGRLERSVSVIRYPRESIGGFCGILGV